MRSTTMNAARLALACALAATGCGSCEPERSPAPLASGSATSAASPSPTSRATAATGPSTTIPSAADDEGPAAPPRPPSACPPLRELVAARGAYARWSKSFPVSPPPEKRPPPKLRAPTEFADLPGGRLAVARAGDIVVVDITSGAESAMPGGGHDSSPAWSPSGTYLAFLREARDGSHIEIARPGEGPPRRASARSPSSPMRSMFSADERWIAFAARGDGVIVRDLQTGAERALPSSERADSGPLFEPGSARLAYMIGDKAVVVDASTGQERRYEPVGFEEVQSITFARGALFIAGSPQGGEPYRQTSVKRLDLDTGEATHAFVPGFTAGAWADIIASPAGTKVAIAVSSRPFTETKGAKGEVSYGVGDWIRRSIFVHDVKKDAEREAGDAFPQPLFSTEAPAWAPDGRHLAFTASLWKTLEDSDPEAEAIVVVDADHPGAAPAYVTCGRDAAWGPRAPTKSP